VIFCIDKSNKLKYCAKDGKKWLVEDWKGIESPVAHPRSRLAGVLMPFGMTVFYQDPEGRIVPLTYSNATNTWQKDPPLSAGAAAGTPLFALLSGCKLHLFFVSEGQDGEEGDICDQALNFEKPEVLQWEGKLPFTFSHPFYFIFSSFCFFGD
jgi:hypothetical protein